MITIQINAPDNATNPQGLTPKSQCLQDVSHNVEDKFSPVVTETDTQK